LQRCSLDQNQYGPLNSKIPADAIENLSGDKKVTKMNIDGSIAIQEESKEEEQPVKQAVKQEASPLFYSNDLCSSIEMLENF